MTYSLVVTAVTLQTAERCQENGAISQNAKHIKICTKLNE